MLSWIKPRRFLVIVILLALVTVFLGLRSKAYRLNRAVREAALRIVQIERVSRTTQTDYRISFHPGSYAIESWDRGTETWQPYAAGDYYGGATCQPSDFSFIFSRGSLREYRSQREGSKIPRYLILEFSLPATSLKKGIIFYRNQDWRVLN